MNKMGQVKLIVTYRYIVFSSIRYLHLAMIVNLTYIVAALMPFYNIIIIFQIVNG